MPPQGKKGEIPLPDGNRLPQTASLYHYGGPIRTALLAFKFYNEESAGKFFADRMAEAVEKFPEDAPDLVCYVPCYDLKDGRRYNQSEVLAENIAEALGTDLGKDVLIKIKNIKSQTKTKNRSERLQNPRGAYAFNQNCDVRKKTVLLIDDIVTTGATLRECTGELYRAGAFRVCRLTAAKASPFASKRLVPAPKNRERYLFRKADTTARPSISEYSKNNPQKQQKGLTYRSVLSKYMKKFPVKKLSTIYQIFRFA